MTILLSASFVLVFHENPFTSSARAFDDDLIPEAIRFAENFDGVTAPQLPAGWSVSSTGTGAEFVNSTTTPDSAPNAVHALAPATVSSASLISPPIYISSANTRLIFRHNFAFENTWDGAILEVSINGGGFQEITAAGGSFLVGGYNSFLNPSDNPIGSRFAWSGGTAGYITTSVQLPTNLFRQNVQFRWRCGTNTGFGFDGWRIDNISVETIATASNNNPITIPTSGTATPYSSDIVVSGSIGLVTGVIVDIENFSHTSPDDVDVVLVAPNGRSVVLMSDAGGNNPVNNISLSFDDLAQATLPDDSVIVSNSYKTANYDPGDVFPAPAPPNAPTGNTLSSFVGSPPNGTWRLFVVDDTPGGSGSFTGGWNLTLQSSPTACPFTLSSSGSAFPITGGTGSFQMNIDSGCDWTASTASSFVSVTSGASGNGSGTVNFTVEPNFGAGRTANITVSNTLTTRTFQIQQASGCPFSLAESILSFPAAGGPGTVGVVAGGSCSWQGVSSVNWVQVISSTQTGNGTLSISVLPNTTSSSRSTTLTVGAQTLTVTQVSGSSKRFDFDGDGKADVSVFRPSDTYWYLLRSTLGFTGIQFGIASDKPAPADFDGDGKTDIAVFRNGTWYLLQSSGGFLAAQFGQAGDVPVPADFSGDNKAEIAVYRGGQWLTLNLSNGQTSSISFGLSTDKPVPADYDGDGKTDQAVYRNGEWHLNRSALGYTVVPFGLASDKPVPADYDGDGKDDVAVYRDGTWYLLRSSQGFGAQQFGIATDKPVPADYDGDGKADLAVYRNGDWYLLKSASGFAAINFGLSVDSPIPNVFVP